MIDGELVVPDDEMRRLEFEMLQQRIHPAESRVRMLAERVPAHFVAFDLLALGDDDYCAAAVLRTARVARAGARRARPPIHVTPATTDGVAKQWFDEFEGAGLDGVVAKPLEGTYQPDKRVMFKIKHERTRRLRRRRLPPAQVGSGRGGIAAARALRRRGLARTSA